ncbi:MAG: homocysteine S-methyltransferase family protein [Oscillospiraceae bacterium]|nr:homocysteine S-methyltransferase family protein [Oscillospiraceae bacterium]
MLSKAEFHRLIENGMHFLDGATGSNLQKMGMPRGCCTEKWVLDNPEKLISLQRQYFEAGSQILYAPTFQAQPIALERVGLEKETEAINAKLVALSKEAAPNALIAGDLTTLAVYTDSWDENNFDLLVENYRRQIRGLIDGGADLLAAETLMYPQEAEAIFTAAELEGAGAVLYTFTMQSDGALFSGMDGIKVLKNLEDAGAAAVGFNCVAADNLTAGLVAKMRRSIRIPLVCKPNAGNPVIGEDQLPHYPMKPAEFAQICKDCIDMGASLIGGCCGTTPAHIKALTKSIHNLQSNHN